MDSNNHSKYKKWYDLLIERAVRRRLPSDVYTEKHHIIPRSMGGTDDQSNIAKLTAREHYIAHLLLVKIVDGPSRYKMIRALVRFACKNGRNFELARTLVSKFSKGENNPSHGKKWSYDPETHEVIFDFTIPDNHIPGLPRQRGGHKNTIWINNGIEETLIQNGTEVPDGWAVGRSTQAPHAQLVNAAAARHTPEKDAHHREQMTGRLGMYHPLTKSYRKVKQENVDQMIVEGWQIRTPPIKSSRRCSIDGIEYHSIAEAGKVFSKSTTVVIYRIKSSNQRWKEWKYID